MQNPVNLESLFANRLYQHEALWILVLVDEVHVGCLLVFEFKNLAHHSVFRIRTETSIELLHNAKLHAN